MDNRTHSLTENWQADVQQYNGVQGTLYQRIEGIPQGKAWCLGCGILFVYLMGWNRKGCQICSV